MPSYMGLTEKTLGIHRKMESKSVTQVYDVEKDQSGHIHFISMEPRKEALKRTMCTAEI